jgi:hypothetical protein
MEVTQKMLDAGYEEALKIAKEQKLMFAVKWFPCSFINKILAEGFIKMLEASEK